MTATKIATCCYCGTRAALVLSGTERHELACSACGAPLHDLKMLKSEHPGRRELVNPSNVRHTSKKKEKKKTPKKRKRKSFADWFMDEALDAIEDIFD